MINWPQNKEVTIGEKEMTMTLSKLIECVILAVKVHPNLQRILQEEVGHWVKEAKFLQVSAAWMLQYCLLFC